MNAPITILLCDDAEPIRRLHRVLFEHEDDFVVVGDVPDGQACIEAVLDLQPDIVLLDLEMPRLGGLGAIPGIHAACAHTRIVVCTCVDDDWNRVRALALGAWEVIRTGTTPSELVERVRAVARDTSRRDPVGGPH
jgi:DNA-binding NarL/FixJ family response regulator